MFKSFLKAALLESDTDMLLYDFTLFNTVGLFCI